MLTKWLKILGFLAISVAVYYPSRHARHYDYISPTEAAKELVLKLPSWAKDGNNCTYDDIILKNAVIPVSDILRTHSFTRPLPGGEFIPAHCIPLIKTAIIIPYRNRTEQLSIFINYMHKFLQQQNIQYRIIIVEQNNSLPFNRARLLNHGAHLAMELNYTCLILHDVDLIPLTTGNLYGCSNRPRHMSSSLDTFRYNLPYLTLFGGAIAILSDQFKQVNGMSNLFYGWGGEDDDFYKRLEVHELLPYRFAPDISKYTMLVHKKEPKNDSRFDKLKKSLDNMYDGLNTLSHKYSIHIEDLFTRVISY